MLHAFVHRIALALDAAFTRPGRVATIATQMVVAILAARMALSAVHVATARGAYEEATAPSAHGAETAAPRVRS